MASPNLPRIKVCGITTHEDAEHAVALGVWAVGLNFWPRSVRRCDPGTAAEIAASIKRRAEVVGIFVNPTLAHVTATAESVGLTMIQFHGEEGPSFCAEAARRTGCKIIKAARVHSGADIQALAAFHVDYHLLDSHVPGQRGGTGETFAWELARKHRGRVPLILSGGLTPENVAEAIEVVRPFAVDVASGVESEPGRKDPAQVEAFVAAVESAKADSVESSPGGELPASGRAA
ncbi:MAG TPA: phosphoribosylanthranilate isomerase [Solirubrobacteraceae bacterium]|jgi:phosphoribosylanthranilate isomerase|nr:phosphoribosylanthranilate isomerase [Solirubrobacteraceae bacterium]